MATKKKGKKIANSKRTSSKKAKAKKPVSKKKAPKKLIAKKKAETSSRKTGTIRPLGRRKATSGNSTRESAAFELETGPGSAGQSGDLQGLRDVEDVDSESVDELLEEGNAFEADVVAGVERGEDDEVREVHTHEVPEDDVPEEYLDKDS